MKILVVAPLVPSMHTPYAGANFLYRHLQILSQLHDVTILSVTDGESNTNASSEVECSVALVNKRAPKAPAPLWRMFEIVYNYMRVLTPGLGRHGPLAAWIRQNASVYDIIEFHFPEYSALALSEIEPRNKRPIVVIYPHDVFYQKIERMRLGSWVDFTALRAKLLRGRAAKIERKILNRADLVAVFSEKDRNLIRILGVRSRVAVIHPPLDEPSQATSGDLSLPGNKTFLFVGALDRFPNDDAVRWLIAEVWPTVLEAVPAARLIIAGAGASEALKIMVNGTVNAVLTGYQPDLAPIYLSADVIVVPLRYGAGLKFKVGTALLWGRPVISTSVGAEGYPNTEGFFLAVVDQAGEFAASMIRAANDSQSCVLAGQTGNEWALKRFSTESSTKQHHEIYLALASIAEGSAK